MLYVSIISFDAAASGLAIILVSISRLYIMYVLFDETTLITFSQMHHQNFQKFSKKSIGILH